MTIEAIEEALSERGIEHDRGGTQHPQVKDPSIVVSDKVSISIHLVPSESDPHTFVPHGTASVVKFLDNKKIAVGEVRDNVPDLMQDLENML